MHCKLLYANQLVEQQTVACCHIWRTDSVHYSDAGKQRLIDERLMQPYLSS